MTEQKPSDDDRLERYVAAIGAAVSRWPYTRESLATAAMTVADEEIADAARTTRAAGFVNPPGGTSEVLPADVLAAIDVPVYVSTACEIAARLEEAAAAGAPDTDRLAESAAALHGRCRLNHKFTGRRCACPHHEGEHR